MRVKGDCAKYKTSLKMSQKMKKSLHTWSYNKCVIRYLVKVGQTEALWINVCERVCGWDSCYCFHLSKRKKEKQHYTLVFVLKHIKVAQRSEWIMSDMVWKVAQTLMLSLWLGWDTTMLDTIPALSRLVISPTAKAHSSLQDSEHIGESIWICLWSL